MRPVALFIVLCAAAAALGGAPNPFSGYQQTVDNIVLSALNNTDGYDRLSYMCDTFGPRLSGSEALEQALAWIAAEMQVDGLDNVHIQEATVPKWVRGEEYCEMVLPRAKKMAMLGLGGSIATPPGGITAEVLVVESWEELEENADKANGRIVVYNVPFSTYGGTVAYRSEGAAVASRYGAVASLTRSITPFSLNTPHTGSMSYAGAATEIPAAAITIEDAELLHRMQKRGETPVVHLYMEARSEGDAVSGNVIAEITGSERPDEVVVFGGHIDSWDVGSGAHDDAGGCFLAWEGLRVLKALGLQPRRSIRAVLFTNEENGKAGATTYFNNLTSTEIENTVFAMESDSGIFVPEGLSFQGTDEAMKPLQWIADLLMPVLQLPIEVSKGGAGADVDDLAKAGVPAAGLRVSEYYEGDNKYFWYHHTNADTPDKMDPENFSQCLATFASVAYVIADMDYELPRTQ